MKALLDLIGSLFVYKSPDPLDGFRHNLELLPTRKLKHLANTKTHYSKKKLVQLIMQKSSDSSIKQESYLALYK